jgi:hypothetical protein
MPGRVVCNVAVGSISTDRSCPYNVGSSSNCGCIAASRQMSKRATLRLMHRSKNGSLFDHLIGSCEQRRRHGETERVRGLEIDSQFVLGR